ncbi:MAG: DJ-1 family glyoxalase III [Prolixibacteraceae bacterium]|jgi:4-methyl-5(b-hydroxyethyl)-thiazole monophosphate biosynthesis|nr:DJ-1/PfpI family protein [Prolixibacteraceae bacterium]MDI9563786.1 DJ-1/PfpI family protein [Bacteroidota bacterium]NLS99995.1 DJ-1/PfpI family protein [Bacteroidales bacterium]OQB81613.1 MAG: Chaperone protein YajL [Bacteroidetes bacterium ADurb.Bin123]HNU77215.1 DJ-1/PfpI family protein [Prolixibacteraceae bacterium]
MKKVAVMVAEGFEEMEVVAVVDVLRRSEVQAVLVSVSGSDVVTGSHNIRILADAQFERADFSGFDMIVLPGGMPGTRNLDSHEGLKRKILEFHWEGRFLGAICAAPMVLGNLGILEERQATCYPGFEKHLRNARIRNDAVVEDGHIITAHGPGVAIEFGLSLAEKLRGKEVADLVAQKMMMPGT